VIEPYHIYDERNRRYQGWTAEKLADKIDEKIEELKAIKKMNGGTVEKTKNNISLMMSNLYFRMKLLADFIRDKAK
jgi:ribosome-binding protein aMBF1 (putative translation factor)